MKEKTEQRTEKKTEAQLNTEEMFRAAKEGDAERLRHVIECAFADVTKHDGQYNNILYYGIKSGNMEVVRYLLERVGINPLEANHEGETPFDLAHALGNTQILSYLEERLGYTWEETYHNPIRRGFFPDPSIVRVGEDYYMVNSTFVFFPCIPISHSRDLIHWEIIGYAISDPRYAENLDILEGGRGYWAPDISYCDGIFYITATLRGNDDMEKRRVQMVTSSARPEGPYSEPVFLDEDGIDPSIFHDDDGRKYMLLNRGARLIELSRDCKSAIKPGRLLYYGDDKRKPEGPHLLKKDGYYYLFLAEGGTGIGHRITVARSRSLDEPFEPCPYNPILHQWNEGALIQCCGHGKPVQLPDGRWAIVYLCLRRLDGKYGIMGRETAMDPLTWTPDGWPVINGGRGPSDQQKLPFSKERQQKVVPESVGGYPSWRGHEWVTPRRLPMDHIRMEEGILHLLGTGEDLNTQACRSVLTERQTDFNFGAVCRLVIPSLKEGQSLGLTCYYDENSYIKYGLCLRSGTYGVLFQEYVGDGYKTDLFHPIASEKSMQEEKEKRCIGFRVKAEGLKRSFFYETDGNWIGTDKAEDTSYLSSEGLSKGKRFTGATVGVYVQGSFWGEFTDYESETELFGILESI